MFADSVPPDTRTFDERVREIELMMKDYEQASLAYLAWLTEWRKRQRGYRFKRNQGAA